MDRQIARRAYSQIDTGMLGKPLAVIGGDRLHQKMDGPKTTDDGTANLVRCLWVNFG
jgi:hypothetical protein